MLCRRNNNDFITRQEQEQEQEQELEQELEREQERELELMVMITTDEEILEEWERTRSYLRPYDDFIYLIRLARAAGVRQERERIVNETQALESYYHETGDDVKAFAIRIAIQEISYSTSESGKEEGI